MIGSLAGHCEDPEEKEFFIRFRRKVEQDRALLESLTGKLGERHGILLDIAGKASAKAGRLKFLWEGLEPGGLGKFEALELLVLGVQGKCLLWRMLGELAPSVSEWEGVDFAALEEAANGQREALEERRIEAGRQSLAGE